MNWGAIAIYGGVILFVYILLKTDDGKGNYKN